MRREQLKALEFVVDEVRLLFHRLKAAAEELHAGLRITAPMRGVMEGLDRLGPQTVPAMARARPVSRQHMQAVVYELLKQKLVETQENPAHKSSPLIALTKKGAGCIRQMKQREQRVLLKCRIQVCAKELARTAESLQAVRGLFNSREWKQTVNASE
jgi:DNA-binding MarR family transcriptional regulator